MADSTVRSRRTMMTRSITNDTTSSVASTVVSPTDSPSQSASSTSLSSLASEAEAAKYGKLLDTYGNEFKVPEFTIKDIRDAIPPHCFERSALRGYSYIARDILLLTVTFYTFNKYATPEYVPNYYARFALWGLYTFLQGLFGTGLWVIAHECGHQSFSASRFINDFTGWVLHSCLLVPYFSWKFSHGKHHKATGHIERDMVFVPKTRAEYASLFGKLTHELTELMEETPILTAIQLVGQQLVGWPLYILSNTTGHNYHEKQVEGRGKGKKNGFKDGVNHFNPSSPLYENRDVKWILASDLGLGLVGTGLYFLIQTYGWNNMLVWYFLPYLWVNHWLVAITFLQHTDPSLPHYEPEAWNFARGAAATIDREFGFIGRHLMHGIIETHVLHHYVSTIPFYNADEATEAIKPIMGEHYRSDTRDGPWGFFKSMWQSARMCQWVEPSETAEGLGKKVLFFRNRNGLGVPPVQLKAQ